MILPRHWAETAHLPKQPFHDLGAASWSWSKQSGSGTITFGTPNAEDTSVSASAQDTYTLRLTATDAAGNSASDDMILTWDTTPPAFTSLALANEAVGGYVNSAEASATNPLWTLTASGQSATAYSLPLDNTGNAVVCNAAKIYDQSTIARAFDLAAGDKPYVICVRLTDDAGNITYGKSEQVVRDTVAPTITSFNGANGASDGYINASEVNSASAMFALVGTDIAVDDFTVVTANSGLTCDGTNTYNQTSIPLINTTPGTDGAYAVCARVADAAGNIAYGKSQVITRDTVLPTVNVGDDITSNAAASIIPTVSGATTYAWTRTSGSGTLTFGSPSAANTTATASTEGTHVLRLTVTDAAGNSAYDELNYIYDTTPPSFTSLALANEAVGGYINIAEASATNPLWTLNASGQTATIYTAPLDNTGNAVTCDAGKTYSPTSIARAVDLPASDKPYVICVRLTDVAGNVSYGKSAEVVRDTVAPTVNAGSDITSNAAANITPTVSDATTYSWTKTSGPGTISFGSPYAANTTATASAQGTYVLRLTVSDAAGNSAFSELTYIFDTTAPVFTSLALANEAVGGFVNITEASATNPLWTLNASDYIATAYTLPLDDTGGAASCSGKTYNQSSIARAVDLSAGDRPYVICVRLTDDAGNITYGKSEQVVRDTQLPTFTSLNGANAASDGYINASEVNSTSAMFTLVGTDIATDDFTIVLADSALTCDASKDYNQASIPAINTIPATDGAYAICARLADAAGNTIYRKSQSIVRDTSAPTVNVGDDITSNAAASIIPTVSGATTYAWTRTSGSGTLTFGSPSAANTTATASTEGTHVLRLTVTDAAGNSAYDELNYIYDTTPPSFTSLALANEAVGGYINIAEASATNPLWTLNASGQTATIYTAPLDNTGNAVTCDAGKTYSPTSIARAVDLPASDKPYVICVRLTDSAGNITYGKSAQVERDTQAPIISSFNGINSASDGYIKASETAHTASIASLVASGHTSTQFTAILSNASLTCDGTKTYSPSGVPAINSMPSVDGDYAVCAKLADAAGNITYGKSQVITRDTVAPTVNVGTDVYAKATYSINASTSGASTYSWTKQSGPGTIVFGSSTAEDTTVSSNAQGLHVLRLTVTDAAGNSAYGDLNFTWDTVAPTFTSIALANQATDNVISPPDITANNAVVNTVTGSGYDNAVYQVVTAATTCSSATYTNSANVLPLAGSLSGFADGSYKVCVKLTDLAGNTPAYGASSSFTVDKTPPTAGASGLLSTQNTNNVSTLLTWTAASDSVTTAANLHYTVYYSTSPSFSTLTEVEAGTVAKSGNAMSEALITNLQKGTTYYFNVVVRDQAGNKTVYTQVSDKTREATFVQVATGRDHACALTAEGKIYCWGYNPYGQLGTGNTTNSLVPVAVNSSVRFRQVTATTDHTCALSEDNKPYCWGLNSSGQLGTGNTTNSTSPIAVNTSDRFKQIKSGPSYSCGLRVDGAAYCWGSQGAAGQLGDGSGSNSYTPVAVAGGVRFRKIESGNDLNCGIADNGDAYCWGIGGQGQLGHGGAGDYVGDRQTPTLVTGGHKFKETAQYRYHGCGIRSDGQLYCWGDDANERLGNGAGISHSYSPTLVTGGRRYRDVSATYFSTCAITDAGDLYCWGAGSMNGTGVDSGTPVLMTSTKKYRQLAKNGTDSLCALTTDGEVHCWGTGWGGKLGNGSTSNQTQPTPINMENVTGDSGWLKFAEHDHACGLRSNGKLYCWGNNGQGQLGDGTTTTRSSPTAVASTETFIDVSVGNGFTCGLQGDGKISCFGDKGAGKLGNGQTSGTSTTPTATTTSDLFVQLTSSWDFTCAVRSDGRLVCWGSDSDSRLGNGAAGNTSVPTVSDNSTTYLMAEAGGPNGCALVDDGTVKCWGIHDHGRLGSGSGSPQASPIAITGTDKYVTISGGAEHMCGLLATGKLKCWGGDTYGELGDGATLANQSTPVDVDSSNKYIDVAAFGNSTCGLRQDSRLYCWGAGGKVADGTTGTNRPTPVAANSTKSFRPGSLGGYYSAYGATSDGWGYAWGDDTNGRLGNGDITGPALSPTPVL